MFKDSLFKKAKAALPAISKTEKEALVAGGTGFEAELFSGPINWTKFLARPEPRLTQEEQAFIDGPVQGLMAIVNEYEASKRGNLSEKEWEFIKEKGFLGLVIPKKYGGLQFSNYAHARIVETIATRSPSAAVSVMVPNSLGPAELLVHYGTESQKDYYLPRLAQGKELPCFGLTGPWAGSDAASLPDQGVVCKKIIDGKEVLGLSITCEKRYITLAPVASIVGLAFMAKDPNNLLAEQVKDEFGNIGITLALIPRSHPGLQMGNRHSPMGAAFMNGTIVANDMFIPMDFVIGGQQQLGQGWKMLMECLATGRAISLPSMGVASAKFTARTVGAYAQLREQFGMPIGKFEGIAHPLSEIGWRTYSMEATRRFAMASLDSGERPSVASGILKYHLTEGGRTVVNHGMDILGGKGICQGPNNFLSYAYQYNPIGITVEGANILTRNLIIFGQGAIRCHPYLLKEVTAIEQGDKEGLWSNLKSHLRHAFKLWVANRACASSAKEHRAALGDWTSYASRINHAAACFGLSAEISLGILGGGLKKAEMSSARLGDALSNLFMASCVLKRAICAKESAELAPLTVLALESHLYEAKKALEELSENIPGSAGRKLLKFFAKPSRLEGSAPKDYLRLKASALLISSGRARDELTLGAHAPVDEKDPVGIMEKALLEKEKLSDVLKAAKSLSKKIGKPLYSQEVISAIAEKDREDYSAYMLRLKKIVDVDKFDFNLNHLPD